MTVPELEVAPAPVFSKMKFSMLTPEVSAALKPTTKSIVLFGIEVRCMIVKAVASMLT